MWPKYSLITILSFLLMIGPLTVHAEKDDTILLIHSEKTSTSSMNLKKLDLLLHHFSKEVVIIEAKELREDILQKADYVIFYNESEDTLSQSLVESLQEMEQRLLFIGENIEKIWPIEEPDEQPISSVSFFKDAKRFPLEENVKAHVIEEKAVDEILLYGFYGEKRVALMAKKEQQYYLGVSDLNELILLHLAELLHDIIENDHLAIHDSYIRLENIHPSTDAKTLREVTELLEQRNIPYILAVQALYTNPETGEAISLKEADDLLEVLKDAQKNRGTVLVNGYENNQDLIYEFWDSNFDQPMIEQTDKDATEKRRSKASHKTEAEYEVYEARMKAKEANYTSERIDKAVRALVKEDLYPLAFSPPFHLLSEASYERVAASFSALFGRVQLSDETANSLYSPPFVTTASFLRGLTVYPETVGDISHLTASSHEQASKKLKQALIVTDSMIGLSYQTYLGAGQLEKYLDDIERISGINWLSLDDREEFVRTDNITIQSGPEHEIQVLNHLTWKDDFGTWINQFTVLEKILWGVTILVFLFVVLFLSFAFYLRMQLKKRLFEERK